MKKKNEDENLIKFKNMKCKKRKGEGGDEIVIL